MLFILFFLSAVSFDIAIAGCVVTKKTCIDAGATKTINGIPVTRDCWGYEEEKTCFVMDTGINGCETLEEDEKTSGRGGCYRKSHRCTESVTDVEGNATCLQTESFYSCENEIALPSLNAAFKSGTVTETLTEEDTSQCDAIAKNTACSLLSETESGGSLIRTYACSEEDIAVCMALSKAGCARVKAAACDTATDPTCAVKVGRMRCTTAVYEDYVEKGDATVVTQTKRTATQGVKDTSPAAALQNETTTCEVTSSVCTDSAAGYRVVNGSRIYATCWAYEETLRCRDTKKTSTCETLEKIRNCALTESTCTETAADGSCRVETHRFVCSAPADSIFEEGAELEKEETEVTDTVEVSECEAIQEDASCRKEKEACLAIDASGVCIQKVLTYTCGGSTSSESVTTDDCTGLAANANCRLTKEECTGRDPAGACTMKTLTYVCGGAVEEVSVGEVCDETLCIGGLCEEVTGADNTDSFLQSAALLEIAREAGVYSDPETGEIFKGIASACSVKSAGPSCCRKENAGAAQGLGNRGLQIAVTAGVSAGFEAIKYVGSPYVYDLLSSHESLDWLLSAIYGKDGTGVYKPSFSFYGVSVTKDAAGSLTMNFSPSGFFLAVAMEFVMDYLSCNAADQLHVMREAAGLCHYVGSYCEKKSGLGCLIKKESWVCFNSKLALLVQEAARLQLGLGWGTPEAPMTRGLTVEEFQSLDFSKMDLTGIITEVARESATKIANPTNSTATATRAKERVTDVTNKETSLQYETVDSITGKCRASDGTLTDCVAR